MRRWFAPLALALAACAGSAEEAADAGVTAPLGITLQQRACVLVGGLDRIVLQQADFREPGCIRVQLAHPLAHQGFLAVELPQQWNLESVVGSDDPLHCVPVTGAPTWGSKSVRGHVRWAEDASGALPKQLDVDLTIATDSGQTRTLRSAALELDGRCQ